MTRAAGHLVALATACVAVPAIAAEEPYRAQGSDPAWSLTIDAGRMVFTPAGRAPISVAAPAPEVDEISRRFATRAFEVNIGLGACTDRVSRRRYAETVFVQVGAREYAGCGGAVLAADDLTDSSWSFVEIGGAPIAHGLGSYSLDFGPGGFLGYSACNRFGGTYSRTGDTLTFSEMRSTRAACRPPHDAHEHLLWTMFSAPVQVAFPDPDTLVMSGGGTTARLSRTPAD